MIKILLFISISVILNASYIDGKKVFGKKCSSCHIEYVSLDKLKDNFRNYNNKLLNLKAPAFNRIEYKILRGKKQIGSIDDDIDIRRDVVLEYLKDYLNNPDEDNSLASKRSRSHYPQKKSMKGQISNQEFIDLVDFIFEYKINHTFNIIKATSDLDENSIINQAIKNHKKIIVEATSKECYYCIKMKKDVLSKNDVKNKISEDFIFIEVNVDDITLPFNLQKDFPNITPTFFFLDKHGKLKRYYPGSWNKKDFYKLLKENK